MSTGCRKVHPSHWAQFLAENNLVHKELSIPEQADLSGLGIELKFYSEEDSKKEMQEFYPGIVVSPDGFVAVASCSLGSGDPYFVNIKDGADGPLYRIYHDEVTPNSYDPSSAVVIVLSRYKDLVHFM